MNDDGFGTTLRVLLNSFAFFVLVFMAYYVVKYNPLWGALVILSAFDQLEDVYFYVAGRRLVPSWFRPIDIVLEGVLVLVGLSMFLFGLIYWYSFDSWFFFMWIVTAGFMTWSAIEDIADGFTVIKARARGEAVATVAPATKFTFFRRLR